MHVWSALRSACGNGFDERLSASHRSHAWHAVLQRSTPDCLFVIMRRAAEGRIDDQGDLTLLDVVHDVWPAFVDLENILDAHSHFEQPRCCAKRGDYIETQTSQLTRQQNRCSLVGIVNTQKRL